MPLTFATQYGIDNLNDIDLGVGRLDIGEYANQVFKTIGAVEGTGTATLNRTSHKVKAGTPMSTVVVFAVDEEGSLKLEPLEVSKAKNVDFLLGQPTSLFTVNSSASAVSTNEAVSASLGNAVPLAFDNLATAPPSFLPVVKNSTGTITYTAGTDYNIDSIHGELTAVGNNIQNNQLLLVTYPYNLPLTLLTFGGFASVRNYRIYWTHQRPQDSNWEVLEAYKVVPSLNWVKSYIQNAHNKFEMLFEFLADITRTQGDRIAQFRTQTQQPF
jgi:hypothetical protein